MGIDKNIKNFHQEILDEVNHIKKFETEYQSSQIFIDLIAQHFVINGKIGEYDIESFGTDAIHAYAIEEGEALNLFVVDYFPSEDIKSIPEKEIEDLRENAIKFLKDLINGGLYSDNKSPFKKSLRYLENLTNEMNVNSQCTINIISNRNKIKKYNRSQEKVGQFIAHTNFYDIEELYSDFNDISSGSKIDVSFTKLDYSRKVNFIKIKSETQYIDSYLAVIPGKMIYDMYKEHGKDMFDSNVRSYLKDTTKINKGIKETIEKKPELFFSYNNGLSIIADKVITIHKNGENYISEIKGLQIVNGGQTATTIFFQYRDNPNMDSTIAIPAKITQINKSKHVDVVSNIAMYNNSQNNISIPDLSSNDPFLVDFENASKQYQTPNNKYWYFERKRGSYKLKEMNAKADKRAHERLKSLSIKNNMLDKIQLALVDTIWEEYPHKACQGASKCFSFFIDQDFRKLNEKAYKEYISLFIIFSEIEKHAKKLAFPGGIKRAACVYLLAYISFINKGVINHKLIWNAQTISEEFNDNIDNFLEKIRDFFEDENPKKAITEWVKQENCWEALKKSKLISKKEMNFREFK